MNEFDEKAQTWDDNPQHVERVKAIAIKILEQIPLSGDMTGFEYGCGTGQLSLHLQPYLKSITLADNSEGMLRVLQEKIDRQGIKNMRAVNTDLLSGPLPTGKFDLVYTAMTLHHVSDVGTVLKKFHSLLKPHGYLCIADLYEEDGSFHDPQFTGHKGFDPSKLGKLLESSGFKNISAGKCYDIVKQTGENETRIFPVFLMVAKKQS